MNPLLLLNFIKKAEFFTNMSINIIFSAVNFEISAD